MTRNSKIGAIMGFLLFQQIYCFLALLLGIPNCFSRSAAMLYGTNNKIAVVDHLLAALKYSRFMVSL